MGLGTCWVSFTKLAFQYSRRWRKRLGITGPYQFITSMAVGFPVGQPDAMVARPAAPVDWWEGGTMKVVRQHQESPCSSRSDTSPATTTRPTPAPT
jgi:hypothetical protein